MLEALFAAAAEAVFSYILNTLEPAERLRDWLKRNPAKLAYQHALARTYAAFARQYPDHTQLVRLWAKSIAPQTEAGQQSAKALSNREDLNAASAYFVELFTAELKHESALQPLFDSRAPESLPAIEAKLADGFELRDAVRAQGDIDKVGQPVEAFGRLWFGCQRLLASAKRRTDDHLLTKTNCYLQRCLLFYSLTVKINIDQTAAMCAPIC